MNRLSSLSRGFTIIEFLIVVVVIALLLAMLLPALGAVRESARTTACRSNLRQVALAVGVFESSFRQYPSAGWSYDWVGDPTRGTGRRQPGGWVFSVARFIDGQDVSLVPGAEDTVERLAYGARLSVTPLQGFTCPSRPSGALSAYEADRPPKNAANTPLVAKSSYAINSGDYEFGGIGEGPTTLRDSANFDWKSNRDATGISFQRSAVRHSHIRDGTAHTYMIGEKSHSTSVLGIGHDQSMYSGYDYDTCRWARVSLPLKYDNDGSDYRSFGSIHPGGVVFAFCDLSVRTLTYDLDPEIHRRLANRRDRMRVDLDTL